MKNNRLNIFLIFSLTFITNCSSVKLSDSYTSGNFKDSASKKMLILARSQDDYIRKSYEDELVKKLNSLNMNAVSSLELFPDLKVKKNRSEEEKLNLIKRFKDSGIEVILLIALKDTRIEQPELNRNYSYDNSTAIKGKYGISFFDYYNVNSIEYLSSQLKPVSLSAEPGYVDSLLKSTTYLLEVNIYDLSLETDSQLIGAFEIEATDPDSAEKVLKKFSDIVTKEFKRL